MVFPTFFNLSLNLADLERKIKKNKCKKAKRLSEEALQIAEKRREAKGKREKELNAEFQRIAQSDQKAFLSDQCKEIEENNRREGWEISSRKLEIPRGTVADIKVILLFLSPKSQ